MQLTDQETAAAYFVEPGHWDDILWCHIKGPGGEGKIAENDPELSWTVYGVYLLLF